MGDRQLLLLTSFRPVESLRLRCNYRGACCKINLARHHSAAGQPGKPVAALLVDWFYVASSFSTKKLPCRSINYFPVNGASGLRITFRPRSTYTMHPPADPVKCLRDRWDAPESAAGR